MKEPLDDLTGINAVAAMLDITPRTLRFYEDKGLITPRRVGAIRVYTRREIARMRLILRGKRLGFSLADIREFLDLYDADRSKHRQMAALLDRTRTRISDLEQQLEDITVTLAELRDMEAEVAAYTAAGTGGHPAPASPTHDAKRTDA